MKRGVVVLVVLCCACRPATRDLAPCPVHDIGAEVQRLVERGNQGAPEKVSAAWVTTVGWGCPCPLFVLAQGSPDPPGDDVFVQPESGAGVPVMEDYVLSGGRYIVTGSYTGRRGNWKPRSGDALRGGRYPKCWEFKVDSWCYEPPDHVDEFLAEELRDADSAGLPWCGPRPRLPEEL